VISVSWYTLAARMAEIVAQIPTVFSGVPARIDIDVHAVDDTKIDFIAARVEGYQGWQIGQGRSQVTHRRHDCYADVRLHGPGVLAAGSTTRLALDFMLPADTPPTHMIEPAYANTQLRVHVSRPWHIDDRARFPIVVRHPASAPAAMPVSSVWRSPSSRGDQARIELGLASTRIAAGDTLVGSVALYHMDDRKPRDVSIAFVPLFGLQGRGRPRVHLGTSLGVTVVVPAGGNGKSVPFAVQAPWSMPPTFATYTQVLAWQVVARAGSVFTKLAMVAVPIEIVDASAASPASAFAMPPGLTDDRVAGTFANFAREHGWRAVIGDREHGEERAVAHTDGDSELHLAYAHRGEAGTFLVARVAYPSLGLRLAVEPSKPLRRLFHKDIELDIAAWDRTHLVHARYADQAIPVLRAAVPMLESAVELGAVARWDDHAIAFERLVIGVESRDLVLASTALAQVAAAITAARELATPPPGCAVDVAAWRAFAASLHGMLSLGDLSIAGARGAVPVHVGLDFDEDADPPRPIAVHATVGAPEHAADLAREITLRMPAPATDVASAVAPPAVLALLAGWPADFVELHLANGVASAAWRLPAAPASEPRAIDAVRARELVDALHAVLAALAPDAGPYR
jgi:hypothetical protein